MAARAQTLRRRAGNVLLVMLGVVFTFNLKDNTRTMVGSGHKCGQPTRFSLDPPMNSG